MALRDPGAGPAALEGPRTSRTPRLLWSRAGNRSGHSGMCDSGGAAPENSARLIRELFPEHQRSAAISPEALTGASEHPCALNPRRVPDGRSAGPGAEDAAGSAIAVPTLVTARPGPFPGETRDIHQRDRWGLLTPVLPASLFS